jgi:hypothetical protein
MAAGHCRLQEKAMSALAQARPSVRAPLLFFKSSDGRPYNYLYPPPDGQPAENCEYERREVTIADARQFMFAPALDGAGFELVDAPTAVHDFLDDAEVEQRYYPELRAIALAATGGREALVFDHLVRQREADRRTMGFGRNADVRRPGPAGRAHCDYTEASGRRRLSLVLGEQRARDFGGRYCIVNVWRSIRGPILDTPLALCDARTVRAEDLVETDMHYPKRTGEIYQLGHDARQQWSYFDTLQPHEAIVFKQYDSARGVARFTPHAAFEHPHTPADAPLRESIEARVLVLF